MRITFKNLIRVDGGFKNPPNLQVPNFLKLCTVQPISKIERKDRDILKIPRPIKIKKSFLNSKNILSFLSPFFIFAARRFKNNS